MFLPPSESDTSSLHWLGEPMVKVSNDLEAACRILPTFRRANFGSHPALDTIIRNRWDLLRDRMPVAVVSKNYVLVQHHEVLEGAMRAFESCGISPARLESAVYVTESGARLAARVRLPERHSVDPGDGHRIDLTFESLNSVDGSVPLSAIVGWLRLVCTNGMLVGTVAARFRQRHAPPLELGQLEEVLRDGLRAADAEREAIVRSASRAINRRTLPAWIDGPLAKEWGPLAAARVYHIARTGLDARPRGGPLRVAPHQREMQATSAVPGAPRESHTLFDITQVLSWVASHRRNFQERLSWRAQIPALVDRLRKAA